MNFKDKVVVVTDASPGIGENCNKKDAEIDVRNRCFANMCIRVFSSHSIPFDLMSSVKLSNNL